MNFCACLMTPALAVGVLLAATVGLAADPAAKTNAPAASKPSVAPVKIVAQPPPTFVPAIAAATQLVQTNMMTVGEARLFVASGSNIVIPMDNVIRVVPAGSGKVAVSAEQEGHTDMMVLDDDSKITEHYTIVVTKMQHTTEKVTYEASLEDFRQVVKKMVGDHQVQFEVLVGPRISFEGTNLVASPHPVLFIHGEAKDEIEANTIRSIASRFFGKGDFGSTSRETTTGAAINGSSTTSTNTVQVTNLSGDPSIVDQMTIRRHHQIRIRVQVAEVNIEAAKQKGIKYSDSLTYGVAQGAMPLNKIDFKSATLFGSVIPGGTTGTDKPAFQAILKLLISDKYARLLSEPTLVTKSGEEASFLAGGQLLQTLQNSLGATTVQTIPFGVRMTIKPTVDRADHIDTEVFTEVSDAPVSVSGVGSTITTRNSSAKLRLNHQETFVLGGLLGNNFHNEIRKWPWIGQVPILGALFRSKDWQNGQSELLFFVTPEIVGEDLKADLERNITTPALKQWHKVDSHKDILPDPRSHAGPDNDVRDFLGIPPDRVRNEELKQAPVVPDTAPMRGASR